MDGAPATMWSGASACEPTCSVVAIEENVVPSGCDVTSRENGTSPGQTAIRGESGGERS